PPILTRRSTPMKSKYILIVSTFLSIAALAQTDTFTSPAPQTFESPGRVATKLFISAGLMSGPLHSVGDFAENDGMNNTYFLYSGDDAWAVTTGIALRTRIREIYAIAKLREMSKTDEFARAMANAGKQKIEGAAATGQIRSGRYKTFLLARRGFLDASAKR